MNRDLYCITGISNECKALASILNINDKECQKYIYKLLNINMRSSILNSFLEYIKQGEKYEDNTQ